MAIPRKLCPIHFYNRHPSNQPETGDIWQDLPTLGLLPKQHCAGIVITPACDLANSKVQTITYLPVVPIAEWFCFPDFSSDVLNAAEQAANALGLAFDSELKRTFIPNLDSLNQLQLAFKSCQATEKKPKKRLTAERGETAVRFLFQMHYPDSGKGASVDPTAFLTDGDYNSTLRRIVQNAKSSDIHFLPAQDDPPREWTSIRSHSVALFRYPMTVPVRLLELANDTTNHDWSAAVQEVPSLVPMHSQYASIRPVKTATLKMEFLSDLLTRFTALYSRLGSPDFDETQVAALVSSISSTK